MEQGVDLRLWITVAAVIVVFILLPAFAVEFERRRRGRPRRREPGERA